MEIRQLKCFVATAEELHFGRAAQRLGMLPAALGRQIRLLEETLGTRLLVRSTRHVALSAEGNALLDEARILLARVEAAATRIRDMARGESSSLRIGAIDSAAAGLLPLMLHDLKAARPDIAVQLLEDKTIRLLPRLLSGRLDLAFVRPPETPHPELEFLPLFRESAVVALPEHHPLAARDSLSIADLADQPLIIPERRSRPHSHDLTVKLFAESGLSPRIAQRADEKQTIINLVAAELGVALVPRWIARMTVPGVVFKPLDLADETMADRLPLAAAWVRGSRDPSREAVLALLRTRLSDYAALA
jgi:DNA-binding transcriptional LysR family regulator